MKISDIKQQVRRQDRYSIYVDGKYVFSFSENELLNLGLKVGKEFSEEGLAELKKSAIEDKAYTRSLDLIMRRQRSEWELRNYLIRKDYDQDVVEKIVTRLKGAGHINDRRFAETWVNNRRLLKTTSKRKLTLELRQKRVAEDVIKEILEEDETDEQQVIRDLIAKKRRQTRYHDDTKLMQYLLRQGFSYNDIKGVLADNEQAHT
jgi:regulatory protein